MNFLIATLLIAAVVATPPDLTNPPASAERLADGLITAKLSDGSGTAHPADDDLIKVRYAMWRPDGKLIDQIGGDQAAVMQIARMLPGWRESVRMMSLGEKRRAWIPSSLGNGKIPDGSSLIIDTELVDI